MGSTTSCNDFFIDEISIRSEFLSYWSIASISDTKEERMRESSWLSIFEGEPSIIIFRFLSLLYELKTY